MKPILLSCFIIFFVKTLSAQKIDKDNTLLADRPIIGCPIQQPPVKNGAKPNPELLKRIIQCNKGEAAATKGMDGAVTVDVASVQIGTPRKWDILRDMGNGNASTWVYPVKAMYTVKTFYRTRTIVSAGWIRILNFYVNAFGEWDSGSEEPVKMGTSTDIPPSK